MRKILILLLILPAGGCRLPWREGPVPQSVADSRRLSQQGMVALDRGQSQKAGTLLAKAVQACPADPEARQRYAEALWRSADHRGAIIQMEEACRLAGEDGILWARLGELYLAEGQLERARRAAERAIEADSHLANAWAVRGGAMQAMGHPDQALTDYLRALNYAPKDRRILLALAELYRQQQQPERALQTLQTVADTYGQDEAPPELLAMLGQTYVGLGRYAEAVEQLSVAARARPCPEIYWQLGNAELLAGQPAAAAQAAQQALAIQPQHVASRTLLERCNVAQRAAGIRQQ